MQTTPLNLKTLLDYAIRLEELGEKFFLEWSRKADSEELKQFFSFLAEEEAGHKKVFETLRQTAGDIQIENIKDQAGYHRQFNEFADTILYNEQEMADVKNLKQAISLAKKQELDARLFFSDLLMYISRDAVETITRIIREENRHFDRLVSLEEKLFRADRVDEAL